MKNLSLATFCAAFCLLSLPVQADNGTADRARLTQRSQAATTLSGILSDRHVLCYVQDEKGKETEKGRTEFFPFRRLSGKLDVAFISEVSQARELIWGYGVAVDQKKIIFDVGDDSPHVVFEMSLEDLRKIAKDGKQSALMIDYPDDEDPVANPSVAEKLICRVPN